MNTKILFKSGNLQKIKREQNEVKLRNMYRFGGSDGGGSCSSSSGSSSSSSSNSCSSSSDKISSIGALKRSNVQ